MPEKAFSNACPPLNHDANAVLKGCPTAIPGPLVVLVQVVSEKLVAPPVRLKPL